jgi:L-lactate dehydrogenase complex protein LldE
MNSESKPHVGLFATCLVDAMRPSIGHAAIHLLEDAGCRVSIPDTQTCCGQPGLNSGATDATRPLACQLIEQFEAFDYVVVPSGSCAGTLKMHYPELFDDEPAWQARARTLADKTWELMSFLVEVMRYRPNGVTLDIVATYHDSCAGLRELGIKQQPRELLASIKGLTLTPLPGNEVCCGFGGTFCVKYPAISDAIVSEKAQDIEATGAAMLLGGDLGCLMNMGGKLSRRGGSIRVMHAAEVLAGMGDGPALGETDR